MFKKKENGFSLVELSVAAAIAVALAVVAVTVVSGTATSVSQKGSSAASVESCTISESLAKAGGDVAPTNCGSATAGPIVFTAGVDYTPTNGIQVYQMGTSGGGSATFNIPGFNSAIGVTAPVAYQKSPWTITLTNAAKQTATFSTELTFLESGHWYLGGVPSNASVNTIIGTGSCCSAFAYYTKIEVDKPANMITITVVK
jgi:prepilin-type N-terminal cleavage/methylation domain-containing protein